MLCSLVPPVVSYFLWVVIPNPPTAPAPELHVFVYGHNGDSDFASDATVSVTNLSSERVVVLEAVEFEGQLPETRYFYHGIYGEISKDGDGYVHCTPCQRLSFPVVTAVLFPNQTHSWKRPFRFESTAKATIKYRTLSLDRCSRQVFFATTSNTSHVPMIALTDERRGLFLSYCAIPQRENYSVIEGFDALPLIERRFPVEGIASPNDDEERSNLKREIGASKSALLAQLYNDDFVDLVAYENDRAQIFKYHQPTDRHSPTLNLPSVVADYIVMHLSKNDPKIPTILGQALFDDIVEVAQPKDQRYFQPPVNYLTGAQLNQALERAANSNLEPSIHRIDSNSLGQGLVMVIGAKVDQRGNRIE